MKLTPRVVLAEERAEPEEDEEGKRERADHDAQPAARAGNARAHAGNVRPPRAFSASTGLGQRKKRPRNETVEDPGRADEEHPPRDREVLDPPDPVREHPGHFTVSSRICSLRLSSSASKTPGDVRDERKAGGPAGLDVDVLVVAVQVDLVGDVRVDDEHDVIVLLHVDACAIPPTGLPPFTSIVIVVGPAVVVAVSSGGRALVLFRPHPAAASAAAATISASAMRM